MSKQVIRAGQKSIMQSNSISGAAGKGMVVFGAGGLLLTVLAGLIPFIGVLGVSAIFIVLGFFMAE
jgi:hypothetical protein